MLLNLDFDTFGQIFEAANRDTLEAIISRSKRELSLENIGFIFTMHQFKFMHPGTGIKPGNLPTVAGLENYMVPYSQWGSANTVGSWIFKNYILPNGKCNINISASTLAELRRKVVLVNGKERSAFVPSDFQKAYDEIVRLFLKDTYLRLVNSETNKPAAAAAS